MARNPYAGGGRTLSLLYLPLYPVSSYPSLRRSDRCSGCLKELLRRCCSVLLCPCCRSVRLRAPENAAGSCRHGVRAVLRSYDRVCPVWTNIHVSIWHAVIYVVLSLDIVFLGWMFRNDLYFGEKGSADANFFPVICIHLKLQAYEEMV